MWFKISSLKLNVDNRCLFYTDQDTGGSIISRLICLMSDGDIVGISTRTETQTNHKTRRLTRQSYYELLKFVLCFKLLKSTESGRRESGSMLRTDDIYRSDKSAQS